MMNVSSATIVYIMAVQKTEIIVIITLVFLFIIHRPNISCEASLQIHHQSSTTQNDFTMNDIPLEKMDQMKIPKDQTLIVRLPSNTLLKYNSYKDVSILHFRVPPDTRQAMFTFKAFEESKSAFQRKCKPRDVTLHLKASSYPVISPENITFPKNFLSPDQRFKIYNLQFRSDEVQQRITVDGPYTGNWFAVAFVSWTDPSNDRIEQQGLSASCDTTLLAEMSVSRFHSIVINNGQLQNNTLNSISSSSDEHNTIINGISSKIGQSNNNSWMQNLDKNFKNSSSSTLFDIASTKLTAETTKTTKTTGTTTLPKVDSVSDIHTRTLLRYANTQPPNDESNFSYKSMPFESTTTKAYASIKMQNISNTYNTTTSNEVIYKFYVPRNIGLATARITFGQVCLQCPDVGFHIQANAYPSSKLAPEAIHDNNYIHSTIIKPNQTEEISIEFYVQPLTWHYALLKFVSQKSFKDKIFFAHSLKQNDQMQVRASDHLERQKRHVNVVATDTTTEINRTITCYYLPFVIQIDYHEPLEADNNLDEIVKDQPGGKNCESGTTQTTESPKTWGTKQLRDMQFYPLLRQTYREFFMYDYDLLPDENGTIPLVLNLTAGMSSGFAFNVGEVYDIGGTLSFAVSMKHTNKVLNPDVLKAMPSMQSTSERNGILAEKLIGNPDIGCGNNKESKKAEKNLDNKNLSRSNQTIIVCMHHGEPGEPTWPDKCRYGLRLLAASSIVNNTDLNASTGLIHVPFPESGEWYVTMGLYCHGAETASRTTIIDSVKEFVRKYTYMLQYMRPPCACAAKRPLFRECVNDPNCFASMNETETLKIKECLMDSKCTSNHLEMTQKFEVHHKFATEQHFALDNCSTSVVFTISSSPCVAGRCGRYGRCYHYMSGGFVFSTCVCMKGYRGWDCTEDSQVPSSLSILMASLLLTLSNLLFFPSIFIAGRRQFYTEAVIYFFAMFFSIFYHACDSGEDEYSFCLVKIGVLQFCDFYCGLLAIWVTLVAMAHVRQQFVSLLHMLGAILLAFGTELNKQSLWVFLAPALTGICLISASWSVQCYKSRKLFPARRYLTVYMPLGTVLVMVGLVCYAFLQTKQNYHIVHSVWHMVMALSILCLLPSHKSFIPKC